MWRASNFGTVASCCRRQLVQFVTTNTSQRRGKTGRGCRQVGLPAGICRIEAGLAEPLLQMREIAGVQ